MAFDHVETLKNLPTMMVSGFRNVRKRGIHNLGKLQVGESLKVFADLVKIDIAILKDFTCWDTQQYLGLGVLPQADYADLEAPTSGAVFH